MINLEQTEAALHKLKNKFVFVSIPIMGDSSFMVYGGKLRIEKCSKDASMDDVIYGVNVSNNKKGIETMAVAFRVNNVSEMNITNKPKKNTTFITLNEPQSHIRMMTDAEAEAYENSLTDVDDLLNGADIDAILKELEEEMEEEDDDGEGWKKL